MNYFEIAMLVLGVVLVAFGYRRNGRNLLLAGAIVLYLSVAAPQFVGGLMDGASGTADGAGTSG